MTRTRFAVTWGNPPGPGDHPHELHCCACGYVLPGRAAVQCGECAHAWRWGWLLVLHNTRLWWRIGPFLPGPWGGEAPWWRLDRLHTRIRIQRLSRIWSCPCCSHDL